MPSGDILGESAPQAPAPAPHSSHKKRISVLGVILTIILTIVVILLGERIIFDLNRVANPAVDKEYSTEKQSSSSSYRKSPSYSGLSYEQSALGISKTRVYYPKEEKGKYRAFKLLIHSSFIIPIFLLTFLLYYLFTVRLRSDNLKVVMWGYMAFAFWMIVHLVGESLIYVWDQFPNAGIYIVLVILAIIFTLLAIFIQKKVAEHHREASV